MTRIAKAVAAALIAAPIATPLAAQTDAPESMAYETMMDRMRIRQAVTESIIDLYDTGEVVEDTSPGDPYEGAMLSGEPIPEDVELQPVPEPIADVLPSIEGLEWARVGDHLVAVQNGTAAVIVWEVLP